MRPPVAAAGWMPTMTADLPHAASGISPGRRAMLPAPTLPLVYFAGAHVALALAFGILLLEPGLPGAFHYHPRLIAIVHLVTLGWISGSILGALYIVAPLALGLPFRARWTDAIASLLFWIGTAGMVAGFWVGRFALVGVASLAVLGGVTFVGARLLSNLAAARRGPAQCVQALIQLSGLGAVDAAFEVARAYYLGQGTLPVAIRKSPSDPTVNELHRRATQALFIPTGEAMRADPRFLPLAGAMGLADYWNECAIEPDFLAARH